MIYLLNEAEALKKRSSGQQIMLFLDFDGTLTPIVETSDKARLSKSAKEALEAFSDFPKFQLIVISGRSLVDIQDRVGVKDIIYAGNHGFEIKGPGMAFEVPVPSAYKILLEHLKKEINNKLADFPGAFLEDKGVTISVHYRQVSLELGVVLEHLFYRMTKSYFDKNEIYISLGKKVFEIRPPIGWNKGKAVMWILERKKGFPVYIGDDTTDEDAFGELKDIGTTVYVGEAKSSCAQYYLNNTDEVVKFLAFLREAENYEKISKS